MTSFGCIAFYIAPLELAVVSAETEVEGETTRFDKGMLLMINRPGPLVRKPCLTYQNLTTIYI